MQRASFSADLKELRDTLPALIPILESEPGWYGSIYFERKTSKTYSANLRQTQMSDQVSMGAVLRIYDGYTLFEQATDDVALPALRKTAATFANRVRTTAPTPGTEQRHYNPPTWARRLSITLDDEIRSQIPEGVKRETPVHFGVRFLEDPTKLGAADYLSRLRALVERCKSVARERGFGEGDLTFVVARQGVAQEESIFVDRESNLSQTLYRNSLTLITMSGADRTYARLGGLGGLESVKTEDKDIVELLDNLKALKAAVRLTPGKYRVLFGPVLTGVLAHEAFGHAQEGDTCARGRSKAWELHHTQTRVGNEHATILNNPAVYENGGASYAAWGSYFFDEEGWLAQEQVLLDHGVLKAPMTNLTSALRLSVPRTANGKRESWANGVYTRQTNTYFSPGDRTYEDLLASIDDGFLATHPAGGMEDPKGMGIQVGISYLQEVKKGRLTGRVLKGPAGGDIQMTGYTPDILNSIVGKSKVDGKHPYNDAGGCGKYHKEFVFAGCGGPYLLLDHVTLG